MPTGVQAGMPMMPPPGMPGPPPGVPAMGMPAAPGMSPGGMPGAGGTPASGFAQMLSQLGQKGANGQLPPEMMTMLTFLAGMGFEPFSKAVSALRPKPPAGSAVGRDAQRAAPGAAITPQMAQLAQLAQMRGGGMPPAMPSAPPPIR